MFVIIKSGGKQYKVQPGDIVKLEKISEEKGNKINLNNVLACNYDNKDLFGEPYLKNVLVKAEILENKKGRKVIVFKKRRRHNSRRLNGHRQHISVVRINEITIDGKSIGKAKPKKNTPVDSSKTKLETNTSKENVKKSSQKKASKDLKASKEGEKNGS